MAKRKYTVVGKGEGIQVINLATPFLQEIAAEQPQLIRKAVKSVGWMMQQNIKRGIRSSAPGGRPYDPFADVTMQHLIDRAKGRRTGRWQPLGKLSNAVGYQWDNGLYRLVVGWLSQSAVWLGSKQEDGNEVAVTDKMRRMFWALAKKRISGRKRKGRQTGRVQNKYIRSDGSYQFNGFFPIGKNTTSIKLPRRETYDPVYAMYGHQIPQWVETKIRSYLAQKGVS